MSKLLTVFLRLARLGPTMLLVEMFLLSLGLSLSMGKILRVIRPTMGIIHFGHLGAGRIGATRYLRVLLLALDIVNSGGPVTAHWRMRRRLVTLRRLTVGNMVTRCRTQELVAMALVLVYLAALDRRKLVWLLTWDPRWGPGICTRRWNECAARQLTTWRRQIHTGRKSECTARQLVTGRRRRRQRRRRWRHICFCLLQQFIVSVRTAKSMNPTFFLDFFAGGFFAGGASALGPESSSPVKLSLIFFRCRTFSPVISSCVACPPWP